MGQYNTMTVTNMGLALLAGAQLESGAVTFTSIQTGNGSYKDTENLKNVTDLKEKKNSFEISSVTKETGSKLKIRGLLTNTDVAVGYDITEFGVFGKVKDTDEQTLIGITTAVQPDFFPSADIAPSSILLEVYLEVANCENVSFEYTIPEGVYELAVDAAEKYKKLENLEYETDEALTELSSGETIFKAFGKIAAAVKELIYHLKNKSNPHGVTASQIGAASESHTHNNIFSYGSTGGGGLQATHTWSDGIDVKVIPYFSLASGEGAGVFSLGDEENTFDEVHTKKINGYTLGAACEKGVSDSSSNSVLSSTGTNLVTERDVYYGTPNFNGGKKSNSTTLYAPTSAGASGQLLQSNGSGAPSWKTVISNSSAITTSGKYALDAIEKNASVEGTLANQIAGLKSKNISSGLGSGYLKSIVEDGFLNTLAIGSGSVRISDGSTVYFGHYYKYSNEVGFINFTEITTGNDYKYVINGSSGTLIQQFKDGMGMYKPLFFSANATFDSSGNYLIPNITGVTTVKAIATAVFTSELMTFTVDVNSGYIRVHGYKGAQSITGTAWINVLGFYY